MSLTPQQRKALHLYFTQLAEAMSDAGWDMRRALKQEVEIPWGKDSVKKFMWRSIQKIMTGKESTEDLENDELSQVYEVLNRHTATRFGVSVPFPSEDEL